MDAYLTLKWLHIVSATVLFGTVLGTAFHFWFTCRGRNVAAIAASAHVTVVADLWFTTPAALIQPATGLVLVYVVGYPLNARWLVGVWILYGIASACWIRVVFIQLRLRDIARAHAVSGVPLGDDFNRLLRHWMLLGVPAFTAMLIILWLMVARPA